MADEEILLDSDLEAVEPVQPKGRNWLKLLSVALVVAAVGVLSVAALPKAVAPLSRDTVELFGYSMTDDARAKYDRPARAKRCSGGSKDLGKVASRHSKPMEKQ